MPCYNFSGYKIKLFIKSGNKEINFETCGCGFTWLIGGRWHLEGKQKLTKRSVTAIISLKKCSRHTYGWYTQFEGEVQIREMLWTLLTNNVQRCWVRLDTVLGVVRGCWRLLAAVLSIFLLHNSHTLQIHCLKFPRGHEDVPREIETMPMQIFGGKREVYFGICTSRELHQIPANNTQHHDVRT